VKLLIVGGGGREHALAWAIRRELPAATLFCAPGNAGTASLATNLPVGAEDLEPVLAAVGRERIDLTIVGPEGPLALGLADLLRAKGHPVFGPNRSAAMIEASKAWAKEVMAAAGIPTASSRTFTDFAAAKAYIDAHPEPLVVKASGLAAGKGAVVCATRREAIEAARAMVGGALGEAGRVIVVESFLVGEELSLLAVTNGTDFRLLPAAQDHKRLLEHDEGPNTGGMGAYSPVSLETKALLEKAASRVIEPALAEMARRNARFSGVLYAGLMIDPAGDPFVVEFNCRFGDPETQVILPRVSSGVVGSLWAAATGEPLPHLELVADAAVTTVLAARGYPDHPEKGAVITIPEVLPSEAMIFHAGTRRDDSGRLVVSGGRVLAVTATGPTLEEAQRVSRDVADRISFDGKQFRRDIGWRESKRK
jgi:phosphoribosylamine--glycine ligase